MHKSVTNLSLFLLIASLLMLVPFTSITFPNVKAVLPIKKKHNIELGKREII